MHVSLNIIASYYPFASYLEGGPIIIDHFNAISVNSERNLNTVYQGTYH